MLKSNNTHISNLRFLSGKVACLADKASRHNWSLANRIAFGTKVSVPQGYNDTSKALKAPQATGGNLAAILRSSSDFAGAITAKGNLSITLQGDGTVSLANANMAANISSNPSGVATLTLGLAGKGWMDATIDVGAHPSAFDIVQAVLNALAEDYNTSGTIGEKINQALTLAKFLGLK